VSTGFKVSTGLIGGLMRRFLCVLLVAGVMISGCARLQKDKDVYYVMFDGAPSLYDESVYFLGKEIGKIKNKEVFAGNALKLTVSIDDAYKDMMTDNVVFYEDFGKLFYDVVDNFGNPLSPGANVLGFDSKISLAWFKTRTLLTRSSSVASKKADRLSALSGNGS
jgi:hypothetical protein